MTNWFESATVELELLQPHLLILVFLWHSSNSTTCPNFCLLQGPQGIWIVYKRSTLLVGFGWCYFGLFSICCLPLLYLGHTWLYSEFSPGSLHSEITNGSNCMLRNHSWKCTGDCVPLRTNLSQPCAWQTSYPLYLLSAPRMLSIFNEEIMAVTWLLC